MSDEKVTTLEDRVEGFILAPSDPAWSDERARDEYYRAAAVGYYWVAPLTLLVSLIAAAEGARITALAVLWILPVTQLAAYRYCVRRRVPIAEIMRAFATRKRTALLVAILIPFLALWCALMVDADPATMAGALVGGLAGAAAAAMLARAAARKERERESGADEPDDVFE